MLLLPPVLHFIALDYALTAECSSVERAWGSGYPHVYDQVFLSVSFKLSSLASPSSPTKLQCCNWNIILTSRSIEFQTFMISSISPAKNFWSPLRGWRWHSSWIPEPRSLEAAWLVYKTVTPLHANLTNAEMTTPELI